MNFKNKVIQHINEEEWRSKNTKDIDGLKKIQRNVMRLYASNNKKIFRDDAIKIAKETNPDDKKKFIKYVNNIFANDKYLTYKEFANRLVKNGIKSGDVYDVTTPSGYENTQVLDTVKNIGANISKNIEEILLKYYKDYPEEVLKIISQLKANHFYDTQSFVRYNSFKKWIHISAIQTDFFNKIRKLASDNKNRAIKALFSEILSKEEDSYKMLVSKLVNDNPETKYFTMNTPAIVRKLENIDSINKVSYIYSELPRKLGFVKKDVNDKNIFKVKKINVIFFDKIMKALPDDKEERYLWFATRDMINEECVEGKYLSEMAKIDLSGISKDSVERLSFVDIAKEYADSIKQRASEENKDVDAALRMGVSSLLKFIDTPVVQRRIKEMNLDSVPNHLFKILLGKVYKHIIGLSISSYKLNKHTLRHEATHNSNFKGFIKFTHDTLMKKDNNKDSKLASALYEISYAPDLVSSLKEYLNNRDKKNVEKVLSSYPIYDEKKVFDIVREYTNESKENFWFVFFLILDSVGKKKSLRLSLLGSLSFKGPLTKEETKKIADYIIDNDIEKYSSVGFYKRLIKIVTNKHLLNLALEDKKYESLVDKELMKLSKSDGLEQKITIKNPSALKYFDISVGRKIELLKNSGFSQEEINKLLPNKVKTNKEKNFSKKIIGESILDRNIFALLKEIKKQEYLK